MEFKKKKKNVGKMKCSSDTTKHESSTSAQVSEETKISILRLNERSETFFLIINIS